MLCFALVTYLNTQQQANIVFCVLLQRNDLIKYVSHYSVPARVPARYLIRYPAWSASGHIPNKYQLSLILDPRDRIVLQTELDDYCDKIVDERRSS